MFNRPAQCTSTSDSVFGVTSTASYAWSSMEEAFLAAWNAKFGDSAPEWVFSAQDVNREISKREARIETLRAELSQELFILEWLQRRASAENGIDSNSESEGTVTNESVTGFVRRQPCVDAVPVKVKERFSSPSPSPTEARPPLTKKSSPLDVFRCGRELQSPDSHVSSEYFSAQLQLSQETSHSESPVESEEERNPVRKRIIHRVSSTDGRVAKAVHRRLIEQGRHWSCQYLDIDGKVGLPSPPLLPKRCLSVPSLRHHRIQQRAPALEVAKELVRNSLTLCEKRLLSPIPGSKERSGERELEPEGTKCDPREEERQLESVREVVLVEELKSEQVVQELRSEELEPGEAVQELGSEKNLSEPELKSEELEPEKDLKLEEEQIGLEPEKEFKSEEEQGGLEPVDELKLKLGKVVCEEKSNRVGVEKETLTLDNAEGGQEFDSRVISEELREPVIEKTMSVIKESKRWSNNSNEDVEEEDRFSSEGYNVLSEEGVEENDPLMSGLVVSRLRNGLYGMLDSDRDDVGLLMNGEVDESCHHHSIDVITPTDERGVGQVETSNPNVQDRTGMRERSRSSPKGIRRSKDSDSSVKRSSAYLEDDDECETPKGEMEPTMALTAENVDKLLEKSRMAERMDSQDTVENSLDMQDLQRTLSTIQSDPDMSVRTLIDVQGDDDTSTTRHLGSSASEPNLLDLELAESMELDEATISAVTLRNDMFGSRSNSVSSLPGLLESGSESSPTDFESPTHQGVSLRPTSNSRKRSRKRMGNAELDPDWEEMILGSELSPTDTISSLSSFASDEGYNLPMSPSLEPSPSPSPLPPVGPSAVSNTSSTCPSTTRSSRIYPVRRSTVLVHGEALVIRKLVVAGIVSAEKSYLDCLTVMKEYYRKPLIAITTTSQPLMTEREVNTIFYRTEDLFDLHTTLHEKLEPQLLNWSVSTCVGVFFVDLCRSLRLYKDYVEMYRRSLDCLDHLKAESPNFRKFLEDVHATVSINYKDVPRVNELLRRPVERLQSYSLVLTDLCQHTPDDHPDYRILRESLNAMSAFIASTHDPQCFRQLSGGYNRELVKEGLVVELSDDIRKVRRLFLFHDVLVSAKQKPIRGGMKFEPKWYLPLNEIAFHPPEEYPELHRPVPVTSDMELSVMKNKIAELKAQLNKGRDRSGSHTDRDGPFKRNIKAHIHTIKSSRSEKMKKKLQEQQVSWWIASPSLPLRVYGRQGKHCVFLLHSEDERESWVSDIKKLQPKAVRSVTLSVYELQDLVSKQTINDLRKVEEMMVPKVDDEYLNGILRVRVMSASELKAKTAGLYCCLELDEYGKFERKARTLPSSTDTATLSTTWDQDFEVEIVGAHIMKVQVCSKSLLKEETYAQGKIRLPIKELRQNKRHKLEVNLYPQGSIQLILEYFINLASMGRKPALLSSGVFGVPIEVVAKRERHDIPLIVQTCVDEVERRGMSEVGVYRVVGVLRDVQELRQAFDTDYLKAQMIAFDTDIHAVAGLLKRYFRELPDPLFTDELYMSFVHGLGLSDPEAREQCLITLLHSLPPVNFKTAAFLFKHLRRVAANASQNKMTLNNLATVFGPNLLRPGNANPMELNIAVMDVVTPVSVVLYFLNCAEEYFDENLFRSPEASSTGSRREKKRENTRKKLNIVEEEDDIFGGVSRRKSRKERESTRSSKGKSINTSSKESVI